MNSTLPTWVERLLGVDAAETGEGTVWGLDYSWSWAPWATVLFLIATVALIVGIYVREGRIAGQRSAITMALLRLGTVALVLFMLAEFVLSGQRTGLPYVVVMVDESESMGIIDRYDEKLRSTLDKRIAAAGLDQPTRLNLAKTLLLENKAHLLDEIGRRYKLKVYFVSSAARQAVGEGSELLKEIEQLEPAGTASKLGQGVRGVLNDLRGTPPAAVVFLTDGITTEGESLGEVAAYARRKNVPLFTIGLGSQEPIKNLKLSDLMVDEVVFVDDYVNFEFKLTGMGFSGREVEVVLFDKEQQKQLGSLKIKVGPDGQPQKVRIPYRPTEVGEFEYVVEVKTVPDEDPKQLDDNLQTRTVSVRKEQVRVLMVQAYPNFEWRRLKAMMERDPTIEMHTVLQEADLEFAEIDRSALRVFPVRRDELFSYDVIIFGDVNPSFLSASAMRNLAEFVTAKGGGLVFIAGRQFTPHAFRDTPLEPLVPVDVATSMMPPPDQAVTDSFVIRPTDMGLASPHMQLGDTADQTEQIWRNLPGVYWFLEAPNLKPAARVLAEHPTRVGPEGKPLPIFVLQYAGAGKVLFHATDETWAWRFRVGDVYFARYWVQTLRYLSRSKLLGKDRTAELSSDREEYPRGEPVRLRVRFFDDRLAPAADDGVEVIVEREGEKHRRVPLRRSSANRGVFEGVLTRPSVGSYHAWLATPTLEGRAPADDFLVVAPAGEFERTQMDVAELKKAASETQGGFYTVSNADQLLRDLPEGRQVPIESLAPIVLWNKWPLVMLFLGLMITEWIWRKRRGLL